MLKRLIENRGVALFMVLVTILMVLVLANVVLSLVANQNRLAHHEISRMQALYAAQAGMVYALEKLRNGQWVYGVNCPSGTPCEAPPGGDAGFVPYVVNNRAYITFCPSGSTCNSIVCSPPAGTTFCVQSLAEYTYSP